MSSLMSSELLWVGKAERNDSGNGGNVCRNLSESVGRDVNERCPYSDDGG
jgi:hypothetical protein